MTPDLFAWADICRNRHGGNAESVAAHRTIAVGLNERRTAVLEFIRHRGADGATIDEVAVAFSSTPNAVSGRFSELFKLGLIRKAGRRATRSGCSAGVYVEVSR